MTGRMNGRHGGRFRQGSRTGSMSTTTKSSTSKPSEQKMLNDYKYAVGTVKQADDYNKITTYLILHIRKPYEHGGNIADAIERQEPLNFKLSAPKLLISSIIETETTSPREKLEIKCQNDQYKIEYEAEQQLHLKQTSHYCTNLGKHTHSYLDNAQQAYSIE